ncbi:MAG: PEP-CTERM sorting domain-containing protein [Coleofasciculus sp. G1-WW12-02]|uniref:PEP-CTERM sorting domain-containing protein n=1 Tax=Coleofasciculus sp. G1-WW12-02 TaxID=3068483 RepID=UPI0032FC0BE4
MKLPFTSTLSIAAATATALVSFGAPAQAASFLGIDIVEDSPVTGTAPTIPHKTNVFAGDGLTYEFSVLAPNGLGSRGAAFSDFGFMSNGNFTALFTEGNGISFDQPNSAFINDWLGTCDITISVPCTVEYTFEKGVEYQFGVWDRGFGGGGKNFVAFGVAQLDSYTFPSLTDQANPNPPITVSDPGYYFIGLEDTRFPLASGEFYYDFQDWVVKAQAPASVPEPGTVGALLGLGALGFISRRRQSVKR